MARKDSRLKVMMLGGLGEIGKNMAVLEYGSDMIIIDCGLAFPDDDMLGVDLVIPDFAYIEKNAEKVRGVFLTHGHEDHIGGIPYLLRYVNPELYGTRLTLGIIEKKLTEHQLPNKPLLNTVEAGQKVKAGAFEVEFVHVNHSIADACALAIKTPVGTVVHTGDFKLDLTPIGGEMMDITRLGEIGREGVCLLMCESTNAERPGYTPSERNVGRSLEDIFAKNPNKRLVIATFSSNVHRVQQIINTSAAHGRRVAIMGRSMQNIVGAATSLGYMDVPDGVLIELGDIKRFKPEQLTLICTGAQGEPMSALYRMAFGEHEKVQLSTDDTVIISASPIPGNEKLVGKVINMLLTRGVTVLHDQIADVHVSGHACMEELKLMQALIKPKYFMPIHGEYRHLTANKQIAQSMGMDPANIFISEIGKTLEIGKKDARWGQNVPSGKILVDGSGVGDVGNIVLRDRKHLSQDGLIVVVATVDMISGEIVSGPDIVSRGFVYVRESEELMEKARAVAYDALDNCIVGGCRDWMEMKNEVKDALAKFLFKQTKRKPMVLPIIMSI